MRFLDRIFAMQLDIHSMGKKEMTLTDKLDIGRLLINTMAKCGGAI